MQRFLSNILILFSVLSLPLWVTVLIAITLCFAFDFFEVIVYGYVLDVLFGVHVGFFASHIYMISAIIMYVMINFIKPYIKI